MVPPVARRGIRQAYALPGVGGPLLLAGVPEILPALARVLHGWEPVPTAMAGEPACTVSRQGGSYAITSPWLEAPLRGLPLASAVCGVVADLAQGWLGGWRARNPGAIALHGGAAVLGGRAFAFTGPAQAGKSTLVARLGAEPDVMILGDDILPVGPDGRAHAMGIAPRLRLPLPAASTEGFREHVAAATCLADDAYAYTRPLNFAPHGLGLDLAGLVVLDRRRHAPARLHALPPAERVRHLLARNMAAADEAEAAAIPALAGRLQGLRLVYSGLEEAVALLRAALGGAARVEIAPPLPPPPERPAPPVAAGTAWRRGAAVVPRRVGREIYLWQREAGRFHHLNPMAGAIWVLLEAAATPEDIAALLAEAYPAEPPARIAADVAALLGRLAALGLVEPIRPAPRISGS